MSTLRPFALVRTGDQWIRCSFADTFLDLAAGVVELAWTTATGESDVPPPPLGAGLAFDRECRLYHSMPSQGRIERLIWKAMDPSAAVTSQPPPLDLLAAADDHPVGDFTSPASGGPLGAPRGLAVDINDRLFIAETDTSRILIYDLWSERLVRQVALPGAQPVDIATHRHDAYAVLLGARQIVRLTARSGPDPMELPEGCTDPSRLAASPSGRLAILDKAATAAARICFVDRRLAPLVVPMATDLEWQSESVLVVARQPGADFFRFGVAPGELVQMRSLRARGYDGLGIVLTPDQRIGYWTTDGFRTAVAARAIFERVGRVTTFRLDSGAYQTTWGRLFLDACIPEGADLRVHYVAVDEADEEPPIARVPPSNVTQVTIRRPDLSAPMPPAVLAPGESGVTHRLHLRESGRERPWAQPPAEERFDTYESPIDATPGRFLWVTLELRGNTRVSPKVRALRAEHPAHDYLRRLPRTFSRDRQSASFLLRYLAMFEGFLGEAEARGTDRHVLLETRSTPDECLPWLASFVGLTLDERWAAAPSPHGGAPVDARRQIIKEAAWLFRYRGTLSGLRRFIELYVGTPVIIIEHFRMRGIGAAVVGDQATTFSSAVVGVGFRIGGAVGSETAMPLSGSVADAFRTHAHRFTVIIPAPLNQEQLDVVRHIITIHRPAHTVFDVCTVDAGMRVGRGLLVALSSVIGPTGGFTTFQIGTSSPGRGAIVGRPAEGGHVGNARIGRDAQVG
jgi:phage tail-like protein